MVSNIFNFYPYLGKWSNLTHIFSKGLKQPPSDFWLPAVRWRLKSFLLVAKSFPSKTKMAGNDDVGFVPRIAPSMMHPRSSPEGKWDFFFKKKHVPKSKDVVPRCSMSIYGKFICLRPYTTQMKVYKYTIHWAYIEYLGLETPLSVQAFHLGDIGMFWRGCVLPPQWLNVYTL